MGGMIAAPVVLFKRRAIVTLRDGEGILAHPIELPSFRLDQPCGC